MKLGQQLRDMRLKRGLSQESLAEAMQVSRQTISKWEMGTVRPSANNLARLGQVFGVSVDSLLNECPKQEVQSPPSPHWEPPADCETIPEPAFEPPVEQRELPTVQSRTDRRRTLRLTALALVILAAEVFIALLSASERDSSSSSVGEAAAQATPISLVLSSVKRGPVPSPADSFFSFFSQMPREQLANLRPELAYPALKEEILAARRDIVFGRQAWTVGGALSTFDQDSGAVEPLPEFSDLFPGWEVPEIKTVPTDAGPPEQARTQVIERNINSALSLTLDLSAGKQLSVFQGNDRDVRLFAQTDPRDDARYNLGVFDSVTGAGLGWAPNLSRRSRGAVLHSQAAVVYNVRCSVFNPEDEGFYHFRIDSSTAPP
ncbi:MAG: helix-turn-helix transcriptional regulator [Lawsonibacter sp.]|nr:helix-turn-helix transcriptional regulator [Lawsonibacter sp.]